MPAKQDQVTDTLPALSGSFRDSMEWDPQERVAVSVRDGVLEYLGVELGLAPPDKVFTVYRSPATIANVASKLPGICLIDGHIDPTGGPVEHGLGRITHADMIDLIDDATDSKLAIRNKIQLDSVAIPPKSQLSLGYTADLVPHDKYDFEQREILPHHLAVVQAGRCGSSCSFIDRKYGETDMKTKQTPAAAALHKVFTDQEGQPNLEQIVEIATSLPEALRKLPVDKLQEILPTLQEIVSMAGASNGGEAAMPEEPEVEVDVEDEDMAEEEEKVPMQDTAQFKDAVKAATTAAVKRHAEVVDKAKNFVDEDYSFTGKTTEQVMRDVLRKHSSESFTDAELPLAFKLLKATTSVKNFGDSAVQPGKFDDLADKELGA